MDISERGDFCSQIQRPATQVLVIFFRVETYQNRIFDLLWFVYLRHARIQFSADMHASFS